MAWREETFMSFNVGDRIKRLREYYFEWSKYKLSTESGVDAKYIKKIEDNLSRPSVEVIEKICEGFDIPLALFFSPTSSELIEYEIQKLKIDKIISGFDFRFNTKNLYSNCYKSIWYSGYIGSAFYDEVEIQVYADGNVKAVIYDGYEEVIEIDGEDVGTELRKYVKSDMELEKIAVLGEFDQHELNKRGGKAVFIS